MQGTYTFSSFFVDSTAVLLGLCCFIYIMMQVGKFAVYLYKLEEQVKGACKQASEQQKVEEQNKISE